MLAKETTLNIQEVKTLGAGLIRHGARPDDLDYGRTDPDAQQGTGDRLEEAAREFLSQPRVMPGPLPQRASADVHGERESVRAEATNLLNEIEGLGGNQQANLSHEKSALAFAAASGIMVGNFERIRSQIAAAKGAEDKAELMDNPEQRKARLWAEIEQLNGRIRAEFQGLKPYLSKEQIDKENKAARELQDANEELQRLRESGASREAIAAAEARYLAATKGAAIVAQETTVLVEANPAAPEHVREAAKRRVNDVRTVLSKTDEYQKPPVKDRHRIAEGVPANDLDSLISPSAVISPSSLTVADATPDTLGKLDSPTMTTSTAASGKARQ